MSESNLLYSEEEEALRDSVRSVLKAEHSPSATLRRCEAGQPEMDLWRKLAEIGALGLHIPERMGGAGASVRELAVVAEELGRVVAPIPFIGSAVMATTALLNCDNPPAELIEELATGRITATMALCFASSPTKSWPPKMRVDRSGRITGTVEAVADAIGADKYVVPALDERDEPCLFLIASSSDLVVTPQVSLDLTRPVANLTIVGTSGVLLASGDSARRAVRRASLAGAALLASEQVGLTQHCLSEAVDYLGQRYQFGRPLGSFQALKHRLADLWVGSVGARAAARYSADALSLNASDAELSVAVAQAHCSNMAVRAAEECIQLHGGIGMTWELPVHLYLKRAKADQIAFGTPDQHLASLAELADLPGPVERTS